MANKPNIRRLKDYHDMDGLVQALRYPEDAETRTRAAGALGQSGNVKMVESLIRAHLQDPDPGVRQAALDSLHQVIGSETELAIAAYALPDDAWIEEKSPREEDLEESEDDLEEGDEEGQVDEDQEGLEEDEEPDQASGEMSWDENDIQALISIIRLDHSRKKRLKAIQALSLITNTRAIDALASIALWSEEKPLREGAREALAGVYGDSLDEVLESYRQSSSDAGLTGDEDDDDEDDGEEDEEVDYEDDEEDDGDEEEIEDVDDASLNQENPSLPLRSPGQPSAVIREEKPGWVTYLLIGLLLVAILAAGVYLLAC